MRSSIACVRCRRSKVKCVNNGAGTTCRACENSGRDCQYPSPIAGTPRRRDSLSGRPDAAPEGEKKRLRKSNNNLGTFAGHGLGEASRSSSDPLDPKLLTPTVWLELFEIFQLHFSADLPFLHKSTFIRPLQAAQIQPGDSLGRPPFSEDFLLAFLALTARFHPKLVAFHCPSTSARQSNPSAASDYYADAVSARLATTSMNNPSLERTQASLMLGLHEWGSCRGAQAWLLVGTAIRAAQLMGLQYEMELDDEPLSLSMALDIEAKKLGVVMRRTKPAISNHLTKEDRFIYQEIRRRTFWSCYILDRYLSSGKYRPQMLHAKELRIQLPASERAFVFGTNVRTLMLGEAEKQVNRAEVQGSRQASVMLATGGTPEPGADRTRRNFYTDDTEEESADLETGMNEGLVSRYIKILEIWSKVVKWSCAGGRQGEEYPPWDPRCQFYILHRECLAFKSTLPRMLTLTHQNTLAHIDMRESTPYTLMHTVYLLCQILLHREYVPFIPIRCKKPEGPLDPPLFPPDRYHVPEGFWEDSARECFKAARGIADLARTCRESGVLVETPVIGFAIYVVAFTGVYSINFPQMDPAGFMCEVPSDSDAPSLGFEAAKQSLELIRGMRPRLKMASGWFKTINKMHKYLGELKEDYEKNVRSPDSAHSTSDESTTLGRSEHGTIRNGASGGGLSEWKLFWRLITDFGKVDEPEMELLDTPRNTASRDADDHSSVKASVESEEAENGRIPPPEPVRQDGEWIAINAVPSRQPSISNPSNGPLRDQKEYIQQPQPSTPYSPSQQQPPPHSSSNNNNNNNQIPNFRPMYVQDPHVTPGQQSAPSPVSYPPSSSSHFSPPHMSHQPSHAHNGWPPRSVYPMQPPSHAPPYPNNMPPYHQPTPHQQSVPMHHSAGYPVPPNNTMPVVWDETSKLAWYNDLPTQLGGDDIAAFVGGDEMSEFAIRGSHGWLGAIYHGYENNVVQGGTHGHQ
nr:putative transcriptional regulatory protein pb1a11.04c [Quercus suber]